MSTSVTENGVTREVGIYACVDGVMRLMSLDTSDATATAADIGAGVTAYGASGKITGTGKVLDFLIVGTVSLGSSSVRIPVNSKPNLMFGAGVNANVSMVDGVIRKGDSEYSLNVTDSYVEFPAIGSYLFPVTIKYLLGKDNSL